MYGTFITLPTDFASSTLSIAGPLISDLSPYTTLILGVGLALLAIAVLAGIFFHHR